MMEERESAEILAVRALAWLAEQDGMLAAYLDESGIDARTLGQSAGDAEVLAGVLDFLLGDDARVIAFAGAAGIAPEAVARARARLPGGDLPHWT